ncbi:FAD-dependent oxidoreductase [Paraneptunicella aestuarii]|uniref:NAD(P)-binding protein n=1 Tax=Paraneptunicella aestuarii TaxID=2831148 RepID=UPI001E2B8B8E|nr:NAD(P)-binding protein [Paraneptunicella aestuarii]UAA39679.1 FAD-dependent oxidoreductase [Paraneptunicella aestuarii]
MANDFVVVGAGISGITSSLYLSKKYPDSNVTLVDSASSMGGLLRSFDYGPWGLFDYGMHNISATGNKLVDDILISLLKSEEWDVLEGNNRDLAGIYISDRLQTNTPYPDVRASPQRDSYVSQSTSQIGLHQAENIHRSSREYFLERFGVQYCQDVLFPILRKTYKKDESDLAPLAGKLIPLGRMCAHSEEEMALIYNDNGLRQLFSCPEQRNLPEYLIPDRKCYYPAKRGCQRVVDSAEEMLRDQGVNIILGQPIDSIDMNGSQVASISVAGKTIQCSQLISTLGAVGTVRLLDKQYIPQFTDKPFHVYVVNIVSNSKPAIVDDLHYFFCYQQGLSTYRVTFYNNFCSDVKDSDLFYFNMEMLLNDEEAANLDIDSRALKELMEMNVIQNEKDVTFIQHEKLPYGFPRPTVGNMEAFDAARDTLNSIKADNMVVGGVLSEPDLFFQGDVLSSLFDKLVKL